jgi:S1-C subfamily serine protease
MNRTRLATPTLPVFVLAAVVVALLAFGITRWITDSRAVSALPALEVQGDTVAAAPGALDANKVFGARVDTVVAIEATIGDKPMNGTGVVVNTDGTIITASHVVRDYEQGLDATTIVVAFHAGDEVVATRIALDQINDLAILKVDPSEVSGLVAAPLGDSDKVLVGAEVMAIGHPFGYRWTPTTGIVSRPHAVLGSRINANADVTDAIQHDAAVNTGNSGGALFNARGELIGINQQIATPNGGSAGISFAVASNLVRRAIAQRSADGSVRYAALGVTTRTLTPQLAAAGDIDVTSGAIVQSATGPAAAAGLSIGRTISHLGRLVVLGDVIVELAGRPITSSDDLSRIAGYLDADAPVQLTIVRGGERLSVTFDPSSRIV